jgi:hypothetical protein
VTFVGIGQSLAPLITLKELQNILQGGEADRASVEQAAVILRESERVMETISNAATKQSGA